MAAMAADTENTMTRDRQETTPMDSAAVSDPRSARSAMPVLLSRTRITSTPTTTKTATHKTRKFLWLEKSTPKSWGRGTPRPWNNEPPTQPYFTSTSWKNSAKAKVAMASQMPPRRMTGTLRAAPTAAAIAAPASMPTITETSQRWANCMAVNAPMAAKVTWHRAICPPRPVNTTMDKKMMEKITEWVIREIQKLLA